MADINYLTKETLDNLKGELSKLKSSGRAEIARQIQEAREKGDLKENAEYDAAKEAQGHHEAKIAQIEAAVINARVIDAKDIDISRVSILSKVTLTNMANKKTVIYQIVSENEADLKLNKISSSSPIGKGILGKHVGDIAEVIAPSGTFKFRVENISI